MLSIGDFAKKTGLTVRALRFYEEKGLIQPPRSRDNDRRFYGQPEFEAVQKIVSLKQLGLPLSEIEKLLAGKKASLPQILSAQLEALEREKSEVEGAIKSLKSAIRALREGHDLDVQTLTNLIRMTTMSEVIKKDMAKVKEKYFSKEQLEAFQGRTFTEAEQADYNARWKKVLGEARALLGSDPASSQARALVKEADALIGIFTQGDPKVKEGLGRMYHDIDQWGAKHAEAMFGMPLEDFKKVQAFMNEVRKAL